VSQKSNEVAKRKLKSRSDNNAPSSPLQQSESNVLKNFPPKEPIEELIELVAERSEIRPELVSSGSRKEEISKARALVACMAVEETCHNITDVARKLGVERVSIYRAVEKGKKLLESSVN